MTGYGQSTQRDTFAGRARESGIGERVLKHVCSGGSDALAIVGEPGIGKTRLLRELRDRAGTAGCRVLTGRGSELEPDTPFGLFIEAMDDALGELEPVALKRLGDERVAELAELFPSLVGKGSQLASPLEVERYRCHYAIRAVVKHLVREQPVALFLDDVHWADPASLELVSFLLRRPVSGMLLVLAHRPRASQQLAKLTSYAARERNLRVVEVGALSLEEAAAMLDGQIVAASLETLYTESGGNPYYLGQLVRAQKGRAEGVLPPGARTDDNGWVPPTLLTTVELELAPLSPLARLLAQGGAVAGDPFDVDLAAEIAEVAGRQAWSAVDELVTAGVTRPTDVPGRMAFRHPVTRRAIYDAAGHGWRVGAHRRAAAELARRGAPLPARAHHVMRSAAATGDQQAVALLVEASRATLPRAPAAAAEWLQTAERLMADEAPMHCRLGALRTLATTYAILGRAKDSRSALHKALALVPPDDPGEAACLTAYLARTELRLGNGERARGVLDAALAEGTADSAERGVLLLELARTHDVLREWCEAVQVAATAQDLAGRLGARELNIVATTALAFFASGRMGAIESQVADGVPPATRSLDEAADAIDDADDANMSLPLLDALVQLISAELLNERWTDAERHAQRGVRLCRTAGQSAHFLEFMARLVPALAQQGRLPEARETSDVVSEALHVVENDELLILGESVRCSVTTLQGQTGAALHAGRNALEVASRIPDIPGAWRARTSYGEALVETGQHSEGREQLLVAGGPDLDRVVPSTRPRWHRLITQAYVADGRIAEARATAERADDAADRLGLPLGLGDALYADAVVSLADGRAGAAHDTACESAAAYDRSGVPIEAARARMLAGTASARDGHSSAALAELTRAHETFEDCGAARLADQAAKELRRLGRRVSRRPNNSNGKVAAGNGGLSEREREVAALVADGRTTRQVAKDLFVSPKTIETHLAHIYHKLGVSSRIAMAAALAPLPAGDEA